MTLITDVLQQVSNYLLMFYHHSYSITVINKRVEPHRHQIGKDGDRTKVIHKYRCWLWKQLKQRDPVHAKLIKLRNQASVSDLILICWCVPLPCHAEVIKSCLEWMMTPG